MEKQKRVNLNQLLMDMDRYIEFCHQQGKPIKQIQLAKDQYIAFIKKQNATQWRGVPIVEMK